MKTIFGYIAAFFTTFAMMPQVIRIWRLRESRDISVWMPVMTSTGASLWLIYGILIKDAPVIIANSVSLVFSLLVLFFTLKYK